MVIAHIGYGFDGIAAAFTLRQLPAAGTDLGAAGTNINGTEPAEFYADQAEPRDWNDGKIDLAGASPPYRGHRQRIALWTSNLATTNSWLEIRPPAVTGFFTGSATIEIFDAGFTGDTSHYVTPPRVVRTGQAWASKLYHFGVRVSARPSICASPVPTEAACFEIGGGDQPDNVVAAGTADAGAGTTAAVDAGAPDATAAPPPPPPTPSPRRPPASASAYPHADAHDDADVRSGELRDASGAARDRHCHLSQGAAGWRPQPGRRRLGRRGRARHLGG